MNSGIYKIYNKVTGDVFVGFAKSLRQRKYSHLRRIKENKHNIIPMNLHCTMYGIDSFVFEILELCEPYQMEIIAHHYIMKMNPSYNLIQINKEKLHPKDKRLSMVISKDLFMEIIKRSSIRNISIKKYVTRAIIEHIKKEQSYDK